jgi:hypothetical protein
MRIRKIDVMIVNVVSRSSAAACRDRRMVKRATIPLVNRSHDNVLPALI